MLSHVRACGVALQQVRSPKIKNQQHYDIKELKDRPLNNTGKSKRDRRSVEQPPVADSKCVQHEKVTRTPHLGASTMEVQAFLLVVRARALSIAHSEDTKFWNWISDEDDSEIALLRQVRWLDISGRSRTITLSLNTTYEIVLVYKLEEEKTVGVNGFPVNVELRLPNGAERKDVVHLDGSGGSWHGVSLGEFNMSLENLGEVAFRIYEHSQSWKCGLAIKSISFRPRKT